MLPHHQSGKSVGMASNLRYHNRKEMGQNGTKWVSAAVGCSKGSGYSRTTMPSM
jgi:hypothetical protein